MIQVTSYIRQEGNFVPIGHFSGALEDPNYIEGAVELTINGRPLLTKEMWDYVDQLWSYLVIGLQALARGEKEFITYFPDQPIPVVFRRVNGMVMVEVTCKETKLAKAGYEEFMRAMAAAAREFIGHLIRIMPANRDSYAAFLASLASVENALAADSHDGSAGSSR